jgi:hypothetical protein
MFEEMVKELGVKVDLLIDKNIQYYREIERLRQLLDEANSANYNQKQSNVTSFDNLKPFLESAEKLLSHVKNVGEEE